MVAIPLEQGRFFNRFWVSGAGSCESQSLWSRDGFSIKPRGKCSMQPKVAIPLEQGRFFNSEVCFSFLFLGY